MVGKIIEKFKAKCIKEFPETDYVYYIKYCTYNVTYGISDKDGKKYYWIVDDGLCWEFGLPANEFKEHFRRIKKLNKEVKL